MHGEVLALHGDSGCGKTTLLECMCGLRPHMYRGGNHRGELRTLGNTIWDSDLTRTAAHLGMVSQEFSRQALSKPVDEAIAYPMENAAIPRQKMIARVDQLLGLMNIDHIRSRKIGELSGGERQAVIIATMLAKVDLRLLIFDNISSDLDPAGQRRVRNLIELLKSQGMTMVVSDGTAPDWLEHKIADKSLLLEDGRLTYFGPPSEQSLMSMQYAVPEFREPTNSPPAIAFEDIGYTYDGHTSVLKDVSGKIKRGAVQGIIGPNGSGKTTLTKILSTIIPRPTSGTIMIGEIAPQTLTLQEMVHQIHYVPQSTAGSFFTQTVREELAFTPEAIGIEATITPEMIGLGEFTHHQPKDLSTGQRQRLAIGCALSAQPDILILDEPTKGLNQDELFNLGTRLLELQAQGLTIIIVSHDLRLVGRIATDVILMDQGRIIRDGPARDVLTDRDLFRTLDWPLPW